VLSRVSGIQGLATEVESLGGSFESVLAAPSAGIPRDIRRARTLADNYARRWLKKAEGDTVAKAAVAANTETVGSLKRIAVTESSEALNGGRDSAAEEIRQHTSLLKVWDAQLDKLTCPICSAADGAIVGIKENFPHGQPGAVHPWCRCTWQVLSFDETKGYIEPKAPGKVISLPAPATKPAPVAKPAAPPAKPVRVSPAKPKVDREALAVDRREQVAVKAAERAALRKAESEAKKAIVAAEKLAAKQIKDTLKAHGVKATGDVRDTVKTLFGRIPHPDEIRGALGLESLGKLGKFRGDAEFSPYFGINFRGGTSNGAASIGRRIAKDGSGNVYAKQESLFLSKAAQGKKLGAAIVREQVGAYERLGVKIVTLNSAEVGRYYWPKVGFNDPAALANAKGKIGKWMAEQGIPGAENIAAAPETMHELATLQVGERKVGKEFLLSDDYGGNYLTLDLTPGSKGLATFKRELGMPADKP